MKECCSCKQRFDDRSMYKNLNTGAHLCKSCMRDFELSKETGT